MSSAAKSNAFSINNSVNVSDLTPGIDTRLAFAGEVALPGTKYDMASKSVLLTGPIDVKLHSMTATMTI